MSSSPTSTERILQPTYFGHIATKQDQYLLLEACLSGVLHHIPRFPRTNELQHVVRSGNIFIYAEIPTGTGDWEDGKDWMFLGREDGFLVKREHFGHDGLFKKSGSIVVQGVPHNVVSYHKVENTMNMTLKRPSQDSKLQGISLRPALAVRVPSPYTDGIEAQQTL